MTDPFRDSTTTALARAEDLERENLRLTEALEEARALVGENHQAFVKNLEDQIGDLKRDNAHLIDKLERSRKLHATQLSSLPSDKTAGLISLAGVAIILVAVIIKGLLALFGH